MKVLWSFWNSVKRRYFGASGKDAIITIVSGLPRSGTSLMMQVLEAGGMIPLTDKVRQADEDNPRGYYEFEKTKNLYNGDHSWIPQARGKVVKIVAPLLPYLPANSKYKIIFMHRHLSEILASQRKMLLNRGEDIGTINDQDMQVVFERHLKSVDAWMESQSGVLRLNINYSEFVTNPSPHIGRINQFLGKRLSEQSMAEAIRPELYRQRKT